MFIIHDQRGFSLLELLITVALIGIVLAGIYNTFQSQEQAYVVQEGVAQMNQNARIALDIMSRDIRNAAYDPMKKDPTSSLFGTGAGARIQIATATTIVFTRDIRNQSDCDDKDLIPDGRINCSREWMGYRYDADNKQIDQCMGSTSCKWNAMVDDIESLRFRYIYADGDSSDAGSAGMPDDADADNTNDFEDIREVEIQIVAQRGGGFSEGLLRKTLTSRVQVRNLAMN